MRTIRMALEAAACALAFAIGPAPSARAQDQPSFPTPEAAVDALVAALEKDDVPAVQRLLGPESEDLLDSGDPVQDKSARADFLASYRQKQGLVADGDERRTLVVGAEDWPLPIPVVKRGGSWYFDGNEGSDELVFRRIGRNELGAIDVCRGFVDAQKEYAAEGRDGDAPGIYALKLVSDPGLHNGLYWPTEEGEPESPVGTFVAEAAAEGYRRGQGMPYHGYHYRMLYQQGSNAKGGAREYFADGLLTQGFGLVAWPAEYGVSGVMTFIVNQDGVVFQRDLGDDTDTRVAAITAFDPDSSWKAVSDAE